MEFGQILGCRWVLDFAVGFALGFSLMLAKILTSPLSFGQSEIVISRDTNHFCVPGPSSFCQNFGKYRP